MKAVQSFCSVAIFSVQVVEQQLPKWFTAIMCCQFFFRGKSLGKSCGSLRAICTWNECCASERQPGQARCMELIFKKTLIIFVQMDARVINQWVLLVRTG